MTSNYNPVLLAEILPLTCGDGTLDHVGKPGDRLQWGN